MRRVLPLLVTLVLVMETSAQDAGPVAAGAKVEKLAGGFKFTEGPAPDAEGNVYFTDQPNDRILKWSTDGKLTTFMEPCGRSNGLCFDKDGNALGLRRREERTVEDRHEDEGEDGRREGLRRQTAERPERHLGAAGRRGLLHRPVLQARTTGSADRKSRTSRRSTSSRPKGS